MIYDVDVLFYKANISAARDSLSRHYLVPKLTKEKENQEGSFRYKKKLSLSESLN